MLPWGEIRLSQDTFDKEHVFVCLDKYKFCVDYYGKPFTNRQHFIEKICKRAGVKHFEFHAIRHLTATILYQKGYGVSFIQKVLRHQHPNTTERYLKGLCTEDVREGMDEVLSSNGRLVPHENKKASEVATSEC